MKHSKKLLWLGIANLIAATGLAITVSTLFLKKNSKSNNVVDLLKSKKEYEKKVNEVDKLLKELEDDKYNGIKSKLQEKKDQTIASINKDSIKKDYEDATKLLEDAINEAKESKKTLDENTGSKDGNSDS